MLRGERSGGCGWRLPRVLTAARPGGLRCQTYSGPSQVRLTSTGLTHAKPPPSGSSHGPSQCNKRPDPLRAVLSRAAGSRPALPGHRASKGSNSGQEEFCMGCWWRWTSSMSAFRFHPDILSNSILLPDLHMSQHHVSQWRFY